MTNTIRECSRIRYFFSFFLLKWCNFLFSLSFFCRGIRCTSFELRKIEAIINHKKINKNLGEWCNYIKMSAWPPPPPMKNEYIQRNYGENQLLIKIIYSSSSSSSTFQPLWSSSLSRTSAWSMPVMLSFKIFSTLFLFLFIYFLNSRHWQELKFEGNKKKKNAQKGRTLACRSHRQRFYSKLPWLP